ncbi:uncharacterized protein ARMOST_01920 [Armillaria ostoyae]|uniref:Uncharacterized protein n=1 Tax=Armillaria ostoyae TaxID=47428 RepID=A0A284QQG8_ARMOS|nr:uncharacterized protein ARMOST_01920 [Armillaria ostoyae]
MGALCSLDPQRAPRFDKDRRDLFLSFTSGSSYRKSRSGQWAKPPPLILNPNLRERHFGIAEGYPWCYTYPDGMSRDECHKNNIFPAFFDRSSRFPGGESVDDLEERTHKAVKEYIFPHLAEEDGFHIALASYSGLCIGELVHALLSYDSKSNRSYTGLKNTAWTRAVISLDICIRHESR